MRICVLRGTEHAFVALGWKFDYAGRQGVMLDWVGVPSDEPKFPEGLECVPWPVIKPAVKQEPRTAALFFPC